jgi:hypothetical protein
MKGARPIGIALVAVLAALLTFAVAPARAHVTEDAGSFEVELGWGVEPPLLGAANFVEVNVTDAEGTPVAVPDEALAVEVVYGDAAVTLPLHTTEQPGSLEAAITPTRPGTYSFHVSGSVGGRSLDATATCSDSTFECVESAAAGTQFPVADPSAGELAQRLSAESERAESAADSADSAHTLAIAALALAAVALALAAWARRRRGSG